MLEAMLWALSTPQAVPARTRWEHNFAARLTPCWAWIRLDASGPSAVRLSWGDWGAVLHHDFDERGLIVTCPSSARNPNVAAMLDQPGWVDFGLGRLPSGIDLPRTNVVPHIRPLGRKSALHRLISRQARDWFNTDTDLETLAGFFGTVPEVVEHAISGRLSEQSDITIDWPADHDDDWSASAHAPDIGTILRARNWSWNDAAAAINELGDGLPPMSRDQMRTIVNGGHPRVPQWQPRLDLALRLDGHLGALRLGSAQQPELRVKFPPYWSGPVWLHFVGADSPIGLVHLTWGDWSQDLRIDGTHGTFTTRKFPGNDDDLVVAAPSEPHVYFGTGRRTDALDIGRHWQPTPGRESTVRREAVELLLSAGGRTHVELRSLIDRRRR